MFHTKFNLFSTFGIFRNDIFWEDVKNRSTEVCNICWWIPSQENSLNFVNELTECDLQKNTTFWFWLMSRNWGQVDKVSHPARNRLGMLYKADYCLISCPCTFKNKIVLAFFFLHRKSYRGLHTLLSKTKIILVKLTKKIMLSILIKPKRDIYNRWLSRASKKIGWIASHSLLQFLNLSVDR